jgi:hypothetical protein
VKLVPTHPPVTPEIFVMAATVGVWLTVRLEVTILAQPFVSVTVNEYRPEAAVVAFGIDGFCELEEKLLGPVQLKV